MSKKVKVTLAILGGLLVGSFFFVMEKPKVYYKTYSPDGQYSRYAKITLSLSNSFNFKVSSGNFEDQKGRIYVYDELKNEVIDRETLNKISNIRESSWEEDCLSGKRNFSIKLPRKISSGIIKDYKKPKSSYNTYSLFLDNKKYIVTEEHNKLSVKDSSKEIVLEDIKYISQIGNKTLQVLNKNLEIEYYNSSLNKLQALIDDPNRNYAVCGNVSTYSFKIEEDNEYYNLNVATGFTSYEFSNYETLYSLKKEGIKNVYFFNKEQKLEYDDNSLKLNHLVIDYGEYFGILDPKKGIQYFDSIDVSSKPIKVMRDGLYGYYNISSVKYKEINSFVYGLAEIKTMNGNIGYIDITGKEYIK